MLIDSFIRELDSLRKSLEKGSLESALDKYEQLLQKNVDRTSDVLRSRSLTREYFGDQLGAIDDLNEALPESKMIAGDFFRIAGLYLQAENFESSLEAMQHLEQVEKEQSDYFTSSTPLMKAYCFAKLGRAEDALQQISRLDETREVAWLDDVPVITPTLIREICASG